MNFRDAMPYGERFIDNYTNKVVEAEIITINPIDEHGRYKGPIKMYVKGRAALYCYPSDEEFSKDWSIPPFDFCTPEDEKMINDLYD
jgi:hypothetical protein